MAWWYEFYFLVPKNNLVIVLILFCLSKIKFMSWCHYEISPRFPTFMGWTFQLYKMLSIRVFERHNVSWGPACVGQFFDKGENQSIERKASTWDWDWLKVSLCTLIVEVGGLVGDHYTNLTPQGVHREFFLDGHPSRNQHHATGLNFGNWAGTGFSAFGASCTNFWGLVSDWSSQQAFTSDIKACYISGQLIRKGLHKKKEQMVCLIMFYFTLHMILHFIWNKLFLV